MSAMIELIDSLENKVSKLLHQLEVQQQLNQKLTEELRDSNRRNKELQSSIEEWEEKYRSLKLAKSMLGSNESKTEAKLKINTLIREIDLCIAQLSE
ncbi:hypothetical protein E7Z59_12105 [Robertkochia marina]|uniref:Cell division protein ZapB n=1 Tax=Robertkochia marina TaxID=1227945 RepID=A0A4S3LY95_9FLAO|nr:hypothetical protein [Robertkochia marina]THD66532.1 hypothetical protein E7Z59_12105 [Robertkochia marina]TRZ45627.1 hypothetical protein D3A96_06525 [Robertkochia marina]